jgi:hypothetical protein
MLITISSMMGSGNFSNKCWRDILLYLVSYPSNVSQDLRRLGVSSNFSRAQRHGQPLSWYLRIIEAPGLLQKCFSLKDLTPVRTRKTSKSTLWKSGQDTCRL